MNYVIKVLNYTIIGIKSLNRRFQAREQKYAIANSMHDNNNNNLKNVINLDNFPSEKLATLPDGAKKTLKTSEFKII